MVETRGGVFGYKRGLFWLRFCCGFGIAWGNMCLIVELLLEERLRYCAERPRFSAAVGNYIQELDEFFSVGSGMGTSPY